jgi:hypothetical protein
MSRHVVLMSRDTSLGVALKALLTGQDRVSELDSPKGWKSLNGASVDIVVLDLPADVRQAALDTLAKRFTGPLVVLLDPAEELGELGGHQPYAVLQRPFGMSELWSLLVAPSSRTRRVAGETAPSAGRGTPSAGRPAPPAGGAVPSAGRPAPSAGGAAPAAGGVVPSGGRSAPSAGRPAPSTGGSASPAGGAAKPAAAPDGSAATSERRSPASEGTAAPPRPHESGSPPHAPRTPEGPGPSAPSPEPATARAPAGSRERKAPERRGPSGTETFPAVEPNEADRRGGGSNEPSWRWRRRRFQQPRKPAPSGELTEPMPPVEANGRAPEDQQKQAADTGSAMWHAIEEAPQAVAARLAERLRADVVALMLDNGEGALETAGGVGLTAAERRLQVEYGHDVLCEVFRVGVGLIGDTGRVRGIINGIPFGHADTLIMVPLAYEGHGFGVLLAGRHRRQPGDRQWEFTELEIEALMDFGEDVAPALRSAVLLRRLKGQLDLAEGH